MHDERSKPPTSSRKPVLERIHDHDLSAATGAGAAKGGSKGADTPTESLSLNFTKIAWTYSG